MSEEKITKIEINMAELNKDVKFIAENLKQHIADEKKDKHDLIDELKSAINDLKEHADKSYAGKWLETLVIRLGWIIVTPVIGGVLYFIWEVVKHTLTQKT